MMKASKILMDEHEKILEMLEVLDRICQNIENSNNPPTEHLERIIDFIRSFADHWHHAKEENLLFPAMEKAGIPRDGGPIGVMLTDHVAGRDQVRRMDNAVQKMKSGEPGAGEDFTQHASDYIQLLANHIHKENHVLFPMGDRFMSEEIQRELIIGFEKTEKQHIEKGLHQKFENILNNLKKIYLN